MGILPMKNGRDKQQERLADHFFRAESEERSRGTIPRNNGIFKISADDGVV